MNLFNYKFGMDLKAQDVIRLMKQEFDIDVREENINLMNDNDQAIVFGVENKVEYVFFVKYSSVNIQKIDTRKGTIEDYRKDVSLWSA